jgi:protein-disulfide isomerase
VGVAEWGLSRAQAGGGASVLGAPLPPAGGADAEGYREQARAASEQARQLQEILDDPAKLERYFADRAAREFEQAPLHQVDLSAVPFKGPPQAPVKAVEYSDFLCPFCRDVASGFSNYLPRSGGRVAIYYKHYPLDAECNPALTRSVHPGACLLSLGGVCAHEQGKFWPYHDRVFSAPLSNPQNHDVLRLAMEAGVEPGAFERCLTSSAARDRLKADIEEARRVGVDSTPTVLINGKRLPRVGDFILTVDKEAARLGAR